MRRVVVFLLVTSLALAGSVAAAQGDVKAAKTAFAKGSALFDKGDFVPAAEAFREANRLNPSWKLYYNIGQAEAAAKRYGLALEAFEKYLAEGGDEVALERNDEVLAEIKRLRELVGALDIRAPEGAAVSIDGIESGTAPLPGTIKVAAGSDHTIRAEKDGAIIEERVVRVSGGETAVVELGAAERDSGEDKSPAGPDAPASPEAAAAPAGDGSALKTWGWVTLGVGAAVAVGGGIAGGVALSVDRKLEDDCLNGQCQPPQHDEIDKRDTLGVVSTVLVAAGAAVAATGAVLLIVGYKRGESGGAPEGAEVSLLPSAGPGFAGAALSGRF